MSEALPIAELDAAVVSVFGESVTYTPNGGSATTITGFFQDDYALPGSGDLEIEIAAPAVICNKADIGAALSHSDQFLIRGKNYRVKKFVFDEGELIVCMLQLYTVLPVDLRLTASGDTRVTAIGDRRITV